MDECFVERSDFTSRNCGFSHARTNSMADALFGSFAVVLPFRSNRRRCQPPIGAIRRSTDCSLQNGMFQGLCRWSFDENRRRGEAVSIANERRAAHRPNRRFGNVLSVAVLLHTRSNDVRHPVEDLPTRQRLLPERMRSPERS